MKQFITKIKFPFSIIIGALVAYLLISYPFESYTLPIIIIWLPDLIGWNAFFVLVGFVAGLATLGGCSALTED